MDLIKQFNKSETLLIVCTETDFEGFEKEIQNFNKATITTLEKLHNIEDDSANIILSNLSGSLYTTEVLKKLLGILRPGGKIYVIQQKDVKKIKFELITNGFMNVEVSGKNVVASRPQFENGSSSSLILPKRTKELWKIDGLDDGDTIDPDELLDEDDLKKPDPTLLRVCGTTGKRKACKDCSCGLADELAAEAKTGKIIDTKDIPKSSCGSCYLGDAFRCATCPYLGMPAFKPGEKIQLTSSQLQDDL